jgi:membrane protein YqaA with SNARE-associated domain
MHSVIQHFFLLLLRLGAAGLVLLGILDSSFLFLPLGNDLLLTALTIRHRQWLALYVICAAAGSTLGVLLLDVVARKGGEAGIQKLVSKRRYEYLKRKMSSHAGMMIGLACLAPPPFPFTPVIATASVFNYPRLRLLGTVLAGRIARFTIIGLLAMKFGPLILRLAKTNVFVGIMIAIIVISAIGSLLSVMKWVRQSKKA